MLQTPSGPRQNTETISTLHLPCRRVRIQKGGQMAYKNIEAKPQAYKWSFAIGTTSRVPGSKYLHYLILDIDSQEIQEVMETLNQMPCEWYEFKTEHGYHFYTDMRLTL